MKKLCLIFLSLNTVILVAILLKVYFFNNTIDLSNIEDKLSAVSAELHELRSTTPSNTPTPTSTPTNTPTETPTPIPTEEPERTATYSAHHYVCDTHVLEIDLDYEHFFVHQTDDLDMILDSKTRHVLFEIASVQEMQSIYGDGESNGRDITWTSENENYFIKAYLLSSDLSLVLYVPKDDTWYLKDLSTVADDLYKCIEVSLG